MHTAQSFTRYVCSSIGGIRKVTSIPEDQSQVGVEKIDYYVAQWIKIYYHVTTNQLRAGSTVILITFCSVGKVK